MFDVAAWLRELGLEQYAGVFAKNDVDLDIVAELSDADLRTLGVTLGHRKKLLRAIAALPQDGSDRATPRATPAAAPAAERRHMTVLFCDLVGSTSLAGRLDPEDFREVIRGYQSACTEVVTSFEGIVAKYLGDGILCYFGYPRAHEDDAERAVRSALAIVRAAATMKNGLDEAMQVRVGIATGLVVVGDIIGEGPSQEQAVVGETPNLAARLQAMASPNVVVIAAQTRDLLGHQFSYESLGQQALAGFPEPVTVWRVLGEQAMETRFGATRGEHLRALVGRDQEIDLLLERWNRAVSGEGQLVLLCGEAGIGKSRIAAALRQRLPRGELQVVQYQCSPHHLNSPLYPVIQQLAFAAGFAGEDGSEEKLGKLSRLIEGSPDAVQTLRLLAMVLSIPTSGLYEPLLLAPQEQKQRTLESLATLFEHSAATRPLLLLLEDAHWIDPTTRELMDTLIERAAGSRAMILVTHRPEFQTSWSSYAHATVLALNRLARRACHQLVADLAEGRVVPDEVVAQIIERTDGVPLFVEELTKTVLESDLLEAQEGRYVVKRALTPLAIPATLHDSLMARLDRLKGAKEIAQIGAAIGRQFSYALTEAVSPFKGAELQQSLEVLRDSDIVFRRGTPPDATYVFKHALIQDAAYESMLRSQRRQIHERIAAALEAHLPAVVANEPEVLAHHFTMAGAHRQAAPMWLKAGQRSLARSANQEAILQLETALGALGRAPGGRDAESIELDIQVSLGSAWIATRGYSAAQTEAAYTRARGLLETLGDDPRQCSVLHGLSMVYVNRANHTRVLALGEEMVHSGNRLSDPLFLLVGHRVIAVSLNFMGRFDEARQHAERAAALYDLGAHRDTALRFGHDMGVGAWWHLSIACCFLGDRRAARKASEQAQKLSRELDNANTTLYGLLWESFTRLVVGEPEEAARIAGEMIEQSSRRSMALWAAFGRQLRGGALAASGQWEAGLQEMGQGTGEAEQLSNAMLRLMVLRFEAEALAKLGRLEEGLAVADEACRYIEATEERWWEPEVRRVRGEILVRMAGAHQAGEEDFRRALTVARAQASVLFEARADACLSNAAAVAQN